MTVGGGRIGRKVAPKSRTEAAFDRLPGAMLGGSSAALPADLVGEARKRPRDDEDDEEDDDGMPPASAQERPLPKTSKSHAKSIPPTASPALTAAQTIATTSRAAVSSAVATAPSSRSPLANRALQRVLLASDAVAVVNVPRQSPRQHSTTKTAPTEGAAAAITLVKTAGASATSSELPAAAPQWSGLQVGAPRARTRKGLAPTRVSS